MINIVFVIDTIESPTAGTEKQLLLLIENLDRSKFNPYLCVLRNSEWLKNEFNSCELVDIGFFSFKSMSSYANLIKFSFWLRKKKIDIVQTHFVDGNKIGTISAAIAGIKNIISTRRNQGYWHNRKEVFFLGILNKFTKDFLCNSESTRSWLMRAEKVNPDKISVIYNAIDTDRFYRATSNQRQEFRQDLGFPIDSIVVGVVANLRPVKELDIFIKAAKRTYDSYPNVRFILVGEGPEKEKLMALCHELSVESVVHFWGATQEIEPVLSCLDIGVLTSSSESFSNAIVEYMASELAVVASDVGGIRETIVEGQNGFIFSLGDINSLSSFLHKLIEENTLVKFGHHGRKVIVDNFSKKVIIDKYQDYYEGLI